MFRAAAGVVGTTKSPPLKNDAIMALMQEPALATALVKVIADLNKFLYSDGFRMQLAAKQPEISIKVPTANLYKFFLGGGTAASIRLGESAESDYDTTVAINPALSRELL